MQVNVWKLICFNCGKSYEDMIDHRSYSDDDMIFADQRC